jgi:saccharopine dehydrogenase-like NADP-dependent oxidoreductase
MRFLLALGLGEDRHIDVRTHLTYRDVLIRRMRQRLGGPYQDAVLLRVVLQGKQDATPRTLTYELIEHYDEDTGVSAIKRCTSIPTAAIALLIASGQVPGGGAAPPENVIPHQPFLDMIAARGLDIQTSWHDGYVGVNDDLVVDSPM